MNTALLGAVCLIVYFVCRLPVLATAFSEQLMGGPEAQSGVQGGKHQPLLLAVLAEELGISVEDISDFELCLADHYPAVSLAFCLFTLYVITSSMGTTNLSW